MLIKYKSCTINGVDMTGKVETVDDKKGSRLIKSGFAELVTATVRSVENYMAENPRRAEYPEIKDKKKGK